MQLAAWIGVCFVAAFLLRARSRVLLALVPALWLLVPAIGSSTITGVSSGPLSVHPASWLVLAVFVVRLFHDPASVRAVLGRRFLLFLVLSVVVAAAFLASSTSAAGGGMVLLVDQILAPVLFFLLLLAEAVRGGGLVAMLRTVLLGFVALACAVAVAQWLTASVLFYESGFKTQYWYARNFGRWMGTLDQPLALSLVICVAAPLVAGLKRQWLQALLLALMAVAMVISQSRVGLAALAVAIAVVVLTGRRPVWVKTAMLVVMTGAGAAIMGSPLIAGIAARMADDTGSSEARAKALEYFLSRWSDFAVAGQGIGASYRVAVQAGLQSSFENPTLMYGVDFGILFAVLYFGSMAVLVVRGFRTGNPGLALAGIMALVIPQTYSSLATRSAGGIIVWTVLAMVVIATDEARARAAAPAAPDPAKAPARTAVNVNGAGRA
jgi:hypothetical protein